MRERERAREGGEDERDITYFRRSIFIFMETDFVRGGSR